MFTQPVREILSLNSGSSSSSSSSSGSVARVVDGQFESVFKKFTREDTGLPPPLLSTQLEKTPT
jgi:hypothetical protein